MPAGMPSEMVSGLVLEFFIVIELELAVDADTITMLENSLPLTDAGLSSSMSKSMDKVVRDDEVKLATWLEDALPLLITKTVAGLCSSMGKSMDKVMLKDALPLLNSSMSKLMLDEVVWDDKVKLVTWLKDALSLLNTEILCACQWAICWKK